MRVSNSFCLSSRLIPLDRFPFVSPSVGGRVAHLYLPDNPNLTLTQSDCVNEILCDNICVILRLDCFSGYLFPIHFFLHFVSVSLSLSRCTRLQQHSVSPRIEGRMTVVVTREIRKGFPSARRCKGGSLRKSIFPSRPAFQIRES